MGTGAGVIIGAIVGAVAAVAVVSIMKKGKIDVVTLAPLPPGQQAVFQSGVVQLSKVTLTHVNAAVSPALYHAILAYSDGTTNSGAVLYSSNINDLVSLGIPVIDNIDNPQDIPQNDRLLIA